MLSELKQQRATIQTSHNFDILKDEVETTIPVTRQSFFIPDVGLCRSALDVPQYQLTCRSGLTRRPEVVVRLEPPSGVTDLVASFPENPVPWRLSPTMDLGVVPFSVEHTDANLAFIRRRKLGSFRNKLELKDIRLSDYLVQ